MNEIDIAMVGNLVAEPRITLVNDSFKTTFRIANTPRRIDAKTGEWRDGQTTYLNVVCWRKLAENAADSLRKGQAVIVIGRLTQRDSETKEGEKRTTYEIDASHCGHDLARAASFVRKLAPSATAPSTGAPDDPFTGQARDSEDAIDVSLGRPADDDAVSEVDTDFEEDEQELATV
jgi:single-strand DNA-binding protein